MVSWWSEYGDKAVLCAVHSRASPRIDEWSEYLRQVRELLAAHPGFVGAVGLAVTDGGAPSFAQRGALVNVTDKLTPTTAVVSDSKVVRVATTALSMFGYRIRVFAPERFADACDHLAIEGAARQRLVDDIKRAAGELQRCTSSASLTL